MGEGTGFPVSSPSRFLSASFLPAVLLLVLILAPSAPRLAGAFLVFPTALFLPAPDGLSSRHRPPFLPPACGPWCPTVSGMAASRASSRGCRLPPRAFRHGMRWRSLDSPPSSLRGAGTLRLAFDRHLPYFAANAFSFLRGGTYRVNHNSPGPSVPSATRLVI